MTITAALGTSTPTSIAVVETINPTTNTAAAIVSAEVPASNLICQRIDGEVKAVLAALKIATTAANNPQRNGELGSFIANALVSFLIKPYKGSWKEAARQQTKE